MADQEENAITLPRENMRFSGHEAAEGVVLDAWREGRMPHAWLITGPAGIGKATFAYRIARFLLIRGDAGSDLFGGGDNGGAPDGLSIDASDPVVPLVAAEGHPDLFCLRRTIDPKTKKMRKEIAVDDVRRLISFFSLTADRGGWRMAIVDPADELNRHSANALLKVLEEPPPRSLLLLVSQAPGKLLPTIRSRCRRLPLRALEERQVSAVISEHLEDEWSDDDIAALARFSEGSPGRALALAEEGGLELYRDILGLLEGLPSLDVVRLHTLADRLGGRGAETTYTAACGLLLTLVERLVRTTVRGDPVAEAAPGEAALMGRLVAAAGLDQWVEVWDKATRLIARAGAVNLDRKQVVLELFFSLEKASRGAAV